MILRPWSMTCFLEYLLIFSTFPNIKMSNIPIFLRGGNDDPMAVYPDEEPPSDTATDRREDLGASNNVNVNLDEGAEGQETRSRSQTSVPIIPIAAPIMNNEPTRNTMGNELSKMETGYHSSSSTSTPANVCNRFRDIQLSPSPEAMKISYGQPASSQCYAPVRPPRARDFHNQQEPIVEHSSEQVENSQLQPDDFELDSYEKIFSGPLQTPKNQTVGPSSSHHGCDFQHQSWSRTTEAIPSSTDSVYQSSPSTFPPSNAPFPDVMRIEYGGPTSSQCMLYAPAHYSSAYDSDVFDGQQPKQYCDLDKSASASLHQATTRNYFPRQGIIEPWSSDYSHNYQHKPLPGIVEVIPSRTDSGYQSSPSTFSLSNVSFPNVVRIEFGMSTSCQHPLYAPARSSRQYSEIVDSQQPKQYCGLNETVSDSWCQLTEPSSSSSSTYDHFQHQSLPDTIEANPTHFAKRKRAAPKNQNPRPAKKSRLAEKQLSHSLLASVQNPMTQDFDRESCSSNTTTFESNYSSSSHNNSPTLLQSVTQKLPVDFFDLGSFEKYVQKTPVLEKLRERAKKESKRRARREVNDEVRF
ncbi:hypothetical protein B9Z55_015205 [Caenorhabditis nigoni]|uniref:Uncharacterized protein n=1 Tax=Caenorhabditis nigoni TaxID=1611254 RepID=A0A2G5U968_9PELO|nr:hypothetical protein B9Z55_015205 [Caenorhabditis nigoni]